MSTEKKIESLSRAVLGYDGKRAKDISSDLLANGVDPLEIIEQGLSKGMEEVGNKFEKLEIFLPELMNAAETFTKAMEVLEPEILAQKKKIGSKGKIVLGTVEGDIHSIGKDIVGMLLKTAGFEVHDLGVDVKSSAFIKKAKEVQADIIGLSSLLTTTMAAQKELIQMLTGYDIREKYRVIVGGAPITQQWADEIGADGYAQRAPGAVNIAQELMRSKGAKGGR